MAKILIIDDEQQLRGLLARIIGLEGYEVAQAPDCAAGLKMLRQYDPDVVLCDVKLPDGNGVEMVGKIKEAAPSAEVILLTAYGNIPDGVQAIKNGAFDYITKGDDNNKILPLLSRAAEKAQMQRRLARFEEKLSDEHSFDRIIGSSEALRQAVSLARKVAATNTSVLLTGETGTGKEIFAQAIHHAGPRAKESFVAVNCSAFSKELLESELFGHRAGSFTGASKDKKGLFEEADKGTLFLDEIGEMPVELQALNIMHLHSPESAILSAVIFNAVIIPLLIPLALRGVTYKPIGASALLRRNLFIYGLGGIVVPFIGIKLIDMFISMFF